MDGSLGGEIIFYFVVVIVVWVCMALCSKHKDETVQVTQETSSPKRYTSNTTNVQSKILLTSLSSNFRIPANANLSILRGYDYTDRFHMEVLNNPVKINKHDLEQGLETPTITSPELSTVPTCHTEIQMTYI